LIEVRIVFIGFNDFYKRIEAARSPSSLFKSNNVVTFAVSELNPQGIGPCGFCFRAGLE